MAVDHPSFIQPDENTTIWHYMDFTKYVSLLEKNALFFSTVSVLRKMDEHEGTYNEATIAASKENSLSVHSIGSELLRTFGKFLTINCWHMNEIESVAMWEVYLKNNPGIAIQSTFNYLKSSFSNDYDVNIGKVHYLSEEDPIPEPAGFNGLNAVLWKRKSYQYETELRAVMIAPLEQLYKYNGLYIPVNLNHLIQKVVISPKAPRWYSELVLSISERYGFHDKVTPSRLDTDPRIIDQNELSISVTCPSCNVKQEVFVEPFVVKDAPNNARIIYSADRFTVRCQNCEKYLTFALNSPFNKLAQAPSE
ncbi:MAG: hypothetical protein KF716_24540 [Anaerolineae bacterium]|nr:hypothetical protein [Anaerolineae bacterium]